MKVLGTPTPQELRAMNPNYPMYEFQPRIMAHPWEKVLRGWTTREANDLADQLIRFDPASRLPPLHVLMHRFFDPLRTDDRKEHRLLFDFSPEELWWCTAREKERLLPRSMRARDEGA